MTLEAHFRLERDAFVLDVNLTLPARGVTAVFGPSGSGKTTLLRAIAGLEYCPGGFLRVGEMIWQQGRRFVPPHKRPLGYVFQEPSLFTHLNVRKNLEYGRSRVPAAERRVSLERVIELLDIGPLLERDTTLLSGGERQRVALARALAVSPQLLLMDEPLAALDVARKQEIMPYLEALHDELEIPVIYVSHSPEEVARLADHLVLLRSGTVSAAGPIAEMLTRPDLPLAHGEDAAAIIETVVAGHDAAYHLTYLDFSGGRFIVTGKILPPGRAVRVRIAARDVSITLTQQTGTSIQNIFPATVEALLPEGQAQMTVRLRMGQVPLLSRITRKSAASLQLQPGQTVYAQVKAVALLN